MRADGEVRWVPVRDVGDVRMGKQLSPASREAVGQFPYLRVANVHLGRIDYTDVKTMGFSSGERETYGLRSGDILLNEGQSLELVGRSAIYDGPEAEYCFQNTLVRFRSRGQVLPAYAQVIFERWLASGVFAAIAKQTTSIAHLGGERFASLMFPLPSIECQRKIIEVIEAVSARERAIKESIAKLTALRLAAVEEWLSAGRNLCRLGDVLERVEVGMASVGPEDLPDSNEWGVIRLGAVTSGKFQPAQAKRLPDSVLPRPELEIRSGDVLMVRVNGSLDLVGSVCIVDEVPDRLMLSDLVMRLVVNPLAIDSSFLGLISSARAVRKQIVSRLRGTSGQFQLPQSELKSVLLPCPPLEVQQGFVARLGFFDVQIDGDKRELSKLRQLRQGLVNGLLAEFA